MNIFKIAVPALCIFFASCAPKVEQEKALHEAFTDKFQIGVAMNVDQIFGKDSLGAEVVKKHFSSIVAENCMKSMYLQPTEGEFYFDEADQFVAFGEQNKKHMVGHTLIWHSQAPAWFFVDDKGQDVSREVLIERMKSHITTVVKRYKGAIKGWDVVNEAFLDDGSMRNSKFYEIIGDDFIKLAFQFAHEADPEAELYYNDYNEWYPGKRDAVVKMVNAFKAQGIRIDAIGMQGHMGMEQPTIADYEAAIEAYTSTGAKVMITEWDISPIPRPSEKTSANITDTIAYAKEMNPYLNGIPKELETDWAKRYTDFFKLFIKYQDKIDRVTLWGVSDLTSWKNDFPIKGRTDYPLLFDRAYNAKPVVEEIINLTKKNNTQLKYKDMKNPKYLFPADYMADPAVHVFEGKLYIYPSHDWESGVEENDNGDHFNMKDYHVFSLDDINSEVTDHGVVLSVENVPWAGRQLWDNDVAHKNGKYYMYFSMKDQNDIFRIGVAISDKPYGPFIPQDNPIKGSYSIDPCVFEEDGKHYMYFGGIWGGQLQRYRNNKALEFADTPADDQPALCGKIALLRDDMLELAEEPRDVVILDENGQPLKQGDTQRRFFEASWLHKYNGKYYYSYSTGDTHNLCYAIGDNPYGPFVYQGRILTPVVGWTTHHGITEFKGKWYLFHHDCVPSEGKTWLRSMKVVEMEYNKDGTIKTIEGTETKQ